MDSNNNHNIDYEILDKMLRLLANQLSPRQSKQMQLETNVTKEESIYWQLKSDNKDAEMLKLEFGDAYDKSIEQLQRLIKKNLNERSYNFDAVDNEGIDIDILGIDGDINMETLEDDDNLYVFDDEEEFDVEEEEEEQQLQQQEQDDNQSDVQMEDTKINISMDQDEEDEDEDDDFERPVFSFQYRSSLSLL